MSAIDALLRRSRDGLDRVAPGDAHAAQAAGALLVDTRPVVNRAAEGVIPGAVIVDRNVLEWRLDPSSPHRIPEADRTDRRIILFCNEGYASSLAAAQLRDLGLRRATDMIGGFRAWAASGLPVEGDEVTR
ncbi:sulfurtransferase [Nocardiopsis gilva YIM 90087]|uniref:Sulfurtransferase n=1 Tax=Nocardiopsis gilva YIM 90087 TaxID=1235441 RepID=A0A223S7Y6_9ACTN|nr:rhodanese-like domain-containing protein [Nocardiopsis gilva]ASU84223.1 sulfurtransferase [Nocardiopsis gilva YIM 90087]